VNLSGVDGRSRVCFAAALLTDTVAQSTPLHDLSANPPTVTSQPDAPLRLPLRLKLSDHVLGRQVQVDLGGAEMVVSQRPLLMRCTRPSSRPGRGYYHSATALGRREIIWADVDARRPRRYVPEVAWYSFRRTTRFAFKSCVSASSTTPALQCVGAPLPRGIGAISGAATLLKPAGTSITSAGGVFSVTSMTSVVLPKP
jgi:hypothetical protein